MLKLNIKLKTLWEVRKNNELIAQGQRIRLVSHTPQIPIRLMPYFPATILIQQYYSIHFKKIELSTHSWPLLAWVCLVYRPYCFSNWKHTIVATAQISIIRTENMKRKWRNLSDRRHGGQCSEPHWKTVHFYIPKNMYRVIHLSPTILKLNNFF